jgi:hypothetical protein
LITKFIAEGDARGSEEISFGGHRNITFKEVIEKVLKESSKFIEHTIDLMKNRAGKSVVKLIYPFGLCLQMIEYETEDFNLNWIDTDFTFSKGSG